MWLIIYVAVAIILSAVAAMMIDADRSDDDTSAIVCSIFATMWPIFLPLLLLAGLTYCFMKIGEVISKKVKEIHNG